MKLYDSEDDPAAASPVFRSVPFSVLSVESATGGGAVDLGGGTLTIFFHRAIATATDGRIQYAAGPPVAMKVFTDEDVVFVQGINILGGDYYLSASLAGATNENVAVHLR